MKRTDRLTTIQIKIDEQLKSAPPSFHVLGQPVPPGIPYAGPRPKKNSIGEQILRLTPERFPEYLDFGAELLPDLRPVGVGEVALAQEIVNLHWQTERVAEMENSLYAEALLSMEEELGRDLNEAESARLHMLAWVRDCNGPRLFDKLSRCGAKITDRMIKLSELLMAHQDLRIKRQGEDTFDLAQCPGWRWYEEMAYLYEQLAEAQGTFAPRLAA